MIRSIFFTLIVIFFQSIKKECYSQSFFDKADTVGVTVNSKKILFPWTGGFNFCQFSTIDLKTKYPYYL